MLLIKSVLLRSNTSYNSLLYLILYEIWLISNSFYFFVFYNNFYYFRYFTLKIKYLNILVGITVLTYSEKTNNLIKKIY